MFIGTAIAISGCGMGGKGSGVEASQSLPAMTSDTAPAGHVASASSIYGAGYEAFRVFDQTDVANPNGFWISQTGQVTNQWLQRRLPSPIIVGRYNIIHTNAPERGPKNFSLQGSNDGTNFTVLDTRTNQTGWADRVREVRSFDIAVPAAYSYYRFFIAAINGDTSYCILRQLELLQVA